MRRIQVNRKTAYYHETSVFLGAQRALARTREGHDAHTQSSPLELEPQADVRWTRRTLGNSIAVARNAGKASPLSGTWERPA
jgi:hypothetical protein